MCSAHFGRRRFDTVQDVDECDACSLQIVSPPTCGVFGFLLLRVSLSVDVLVAFDGGRISLFWVIMTIIMPAEPSSK